MGTETSVKWPSLRGEPERAACRKPGADPARHPHHRPPLPLPTGRPATFSGLPVLFSDKYSLGGLQLLFWLFGGPPESLLMGTVGPDRRQEYHSHSPRFAQRLLRLVAFQLLYLIMLFALGDQQPFM